uniref:Retrovirus-related Pol polyprotein from transposon TNT 1-94-like beta-barrel domain-containing protein n=1 Tax=Lactuca sativa TaxID=4236 RepID=A0A9R1V0B1_LACSA|nr:hypothetical protein LSAT_V11C700348380 [Lactuca sativa]
MKIKIKMFLTCKGNEEGNKNIWYFDNGASNHICGYKDLFMKLDKTVGDVSFGDLSTILIKGKGTIMILSKDGDKKYIHDVYYAYALKTNVTSQKPW